ncbi:MAG TPA: SDR family oxidoreductase [Pyrinomonadaceae bacterium]|nr:SDR family oxidoreductase [Pyrinomonadaceae bacterium]
MILLTGATGTTGGDVVKELAGAGRRDVRVMVRDTKKAGALGAHGFEVGSGDFDDAASLDAALAGVETALLLPPPDPQMVERQSRFIAAARRAGVGRIVKLSAFGADASAAEGFARWHGLSEDELRASGLAWTILRPNFFMQNMLNSAHSIREQGVFYQPVGDARASFVDTRDVAAVTARVLTEDAHEGQTYILTGAEALSYQDVAERLSQATGRTISYVGISPEQFRAGALDAGLPAWLVDALERLNQTFASGAAAVVTDAVRVLTKREPLTFADFARDYAQAFGAGA